MHELSEGPAFYGDPSWGGWGGNLAGMGRWDAVLIWWVTKEPSVTDPNCQWFELL